MHYCDCEAILFAAADLIENQQRHIEALIQANDSLKDGLAMHGWIPVTEGIV